MKASLNFLPKPEKKSSKSGRIPLYARVCLNGKKCERRLNIEVTETELLKWNPISMRFSDRSFYGNTVISVIDVRFGQFLGSYCLNLHEHTPESIMNFIIGEVKEKPVLALSYSEGYYQDTVSNNGNLAEGTKKIYKKAINHFRNFLKYSNNENLTISSLSNSIALQFKDYLLKEVELSLSPKKVKIAMTEPSAAVIVKKFRTIFDRAILEGKLEKNPFKIVKLKHRSARRGRLSINEVKKLAELDLTNFEAQKVYRDIFLFSVFTGLAYQDAMYLKKTELQYLPSGEIKLKTDRTKTGVQTELFLTKQAAEITDRYSNQLEQNIRGNILPYRSNKEVNLQLKYLADLANIPMKLSHHIARHTYRQLLAEAEIEDMAVIKKMMGQIRSYDIDDIYYLVTDNKLLAAKEKFQIYLNRFL